MEKSDSNKMVTNMSESSSLGFNVNDMVFETTKSYGEGKGLNILYKGEIKPYIEETKLLLEPLKTYINVGINAIEFKNTTVTQKKIGDLKITLGNLKKNEKKFNKESKDELTKINKEIKKIKKIAGSKRTPGGLTIIDEEPKEKSKELSNKKKREEEDDVLEDKNEIRVGTELASLETKIAIIDIIKLKNAKEIKLFEDLYKDLIKYEKAPKKDLNTAEENLKKSVNKLIKKHRSLIKELRNLANNIRSDENLSKNTKILKEIDDLIIEHTGGNIAKKAVDPLERSYAVIQLFEVKRQLNSAIKLIKKEQSIFGRTQNFLFGKRPLLELEKRVDDIKNKYKEKTPESYKTDIDDVFKNIQGVFNEAIELMSEKQQQSPLSKLRNLLFRTQSNSDILSKFETVFKRTNEVYGNISSDEGGRTISKKKHWNQNGVSNGGGIKNLKNLATTPKEKESEVESLERTLHEWGGLSNGQKGGTKDGLDKLRGLNSSIKSPKSNQKSKKRL